MYGGLGSTYGVSGGECMLAASCSAASLTRGTKRHSPSERGGKEEPGRGEPRELSTREAICGDAPCVGAVFVAGGVGGHATTSTPLIEDVAEYVMISRGVMPWSAERAECGAERSFARAARATSSRRAEYTRIAGHSRSLSDAPGKEGAHVRRDGSRTAVVASVQNSFSTK